MRPGIGIVGAGMVGQMCHLANFAASSACRVVAIADLRADLAAAAARRFGIDRVYSTHRDLLADADVSAVVVVTRRRATGPIVLDALTSGRHVLSEKPMAYTVAQAKTLVAAAQQRHLVYAVGYMKRHDAGVARLRDELHRRRADGSLGRILRADGWCHGGDTGGSPDRFVMTAEPRPDGLDLWPDGPDGMRADLRPGYDHFLNVFSHLINLSRHLLGASPRLLDGRVDGAGSAQVTLAFDGVPCRLDLATRAGGDWREGLTIVFERGQITLELPPPFSEQEADVTITQDGRTMRLPRGTSWAFRRQADAFIADIIARTPPLAPAADSATDIALAEAIWKLA